MQNEPPKSAAAAQTEQHGESSKESPVAQAKIPAAWESLIGTQLVGHDGKSVPLETVLSGKKVLAFYFSASWCPPCRSFTPKLVDFYHDNKGDMAVVLVTSDRSYGDMIEYMRSHSMPWPAIPHGDTHIRTLSSKYGVRGIPALVVVDESGRLITSEGRSDVMRKGNKAILDWIR